MPHRIWIITWGCHEYIPVCFKTSFIFVRMILIKEHRIIIILCGRRHVNSLICIYIILCIIESDFIDFRKNSCSFCQLVFWVNSTSSCGPHEFEVFLWNESKISSTTILTNISIILSSHSYSFSPCRQRSGSILFASNISLISNLSQHQTIHQIQNLINTVNNSKYDRLHFDSSAHTLKSTSQIDHLFKQYSPSTDMNFPKQAHCTFISLSLFQFVSNIVLLIFI